MTRILALLFLLILGTAADAQSLRRSTAETTEAQWAAIRRGVEVMRSRDGAPRGSADWRRSWRYWANLHQHFGADCRGAVTGRGMAGAGAWVAETPDEIATWCSAEHSNAQFLTWHRMAVYQFERVLGEAAGVRNLRLPYWDVAANPTLPPAFRAPTVGGRPNPLYVANRSPGMNAGTASVSTFARSAANAMAATTYATFNARLENNPHGGVHCAVSGGCPTGYMGALASAALDPIFWLHHANIDRLYECWLRAAPAGASRLPTGAMLDRRYGFILPSGELARVAVRNRLTAAQMGYGYTQGMGCGR